MAWGRVFNSLSLILPWHRRVMGSHEESPLLEFLLIVMVVCIAFLPFTGGDLGGESNSSEDGGVNLTGVFNESEIERACREKGFQEGYYRGDYFGNYNCYNSSTFSEDEIREEVISSDSE